LCRGERGHPRPHRDTSPGPAPLGHLGASINVVLSMRAMPQPRPIFPNFYYFHICLSVLKMVTGTFAPKNFRSREQKYHGMELSLPGTFTPGSESSKNFRSLELSFPGTIAPWLYIYISRDRFQRERLGTAFP